MIVCVALQVASLCVYPIIFENSVVYREQVLTRHAHVTGVSYRGSWGVEMEGSRGGRVGGEGGVGG